MLPFVRICFTSVLSLVSMPLEADDVVLPENSSVPMEHRQLLGWSAWFLDYEPTWTHAARIRCLRLNPQLPISG